MNCFFKKEKNGKERREVGSVEGNRARFVGF